jgi:hypothetical protein
MHQRKTDFRVSPHDSEFHHLPSEYKPPPFKIEDCPSYLVFTRASTFCSSADTTTTISVQRSYDLGHAIQLMNQTENVERATTGNAKMIPPKHRK